MNSPDQPFSAIVLAADRELHDPVAQTAAVSCKALTPVSGRAMVLRVLDALGGSARGGHPDSRRTAMASVEQNAELNSLVSSARFSGLPRRPQPSSSAFSVLQSLPKECPCWSPPPIMPC